MARAKFKMWRISGGTKPGFLRYWKVITFLFLNNPFTNNKHLLDEVFVISGIIKSRYVLSAEAKIEVDNTYRDLDYLGYHKNRI